MGQKNILLNETYKEDVKIKSEWGESIEAILCINGIKNMRAEFPLPAHVKFHKDFKKRFDDQYIQRHFNPACLLICNTNMILRGLPVIQT